MDHEAARHAILEAALRHVPFDGWTISAIRRGVADAGFGPEMALEAFPGGVSELISFHIAEADRNMLVALEAHDLAAMRTRDRVALAIRLRLEQQAEHREAIRRAVAWLALPTNAPLAARTLYRTVDAIWFAAGDRSTDFNFYTKRGLLAGVYSTTMLFWLNDRSEEMTASWAFLDRRIEEIMRVGKFLGRARGMTERCPNPFRILAGLGRRAAPRW